MYVVNNFYFHLYLNQYQRLETKRCMDELSKKVASHDKEALMNWASGKEVDHWKNSFLINLNNDSVQFLSKGPDKVASTKDDIYGDVFQNKKCHMKML